MNNRFLIGIALISSPFIISAQSLSEAIKKTDNERFESAATDFKALTAKESTKGDNYFYFGENYFKNNDLDSALLMYKKGAEVNATFPLNHVGIAKVSLWKGNEAEANTNFFKAKSIVEDKANKSLKPITYMKIAEALTNTPQNKNVAEAIKLLNDAIKADAKNPEVYILMGDALLEQNQTEGGPAIKQYDKAFELDQKSVKAILRKGKLYQRARNYNLALDFYKQAESIDPNFAPAYREKGELYHLAGQDNKAVENYKKYLELNNSTEARKRYSYFLFGSKQYGEVIKEVPSLIQQDAKNPYLYRVLAYSYYEFNDKADLEAPKKGLEAIDKFFEFQLFHQPLIHLLCTTEDLLHIH
jgi:tetratricopeptide (TPR) repeat protein